LAEPARTLRNASPAAPAAPVAQKPAGPPPLVPGQPPAMPSVQDFGLWSGFEGREELLGRGLVQLLKTVIADVPYQHHLNDAALKAHLNAIGNPEYGLVGLFERTDCWYQLVLEWTVEPGRRSWRSPFHTVLAMGKRIGQFDLTEQEIHEEWTVPRIQGYAADIGIKVKISPWQESGWLACELA